MDNTTAQTMLGRYRLLRKIGQGGMGDVWLAEDPVLRRQVAIKTLPRHDRDDAEFVMRFEREARAAAALHHPHILPVHDYGQQQTPSGEQISYIVMSYIGGGSVGDLLARHIKAQTLLPPSEAITYLRQVAEAIDFAHQRGIVHRDIKPANMLLREDKWLLLADFGLARILSDTEHLTQAGVGFGTPKYMAPEQAQGRAVASSDIYSLAVVAYEFFAGRVPFTGDTPYAITVQHILTPPPSPLQFNPALPPAFADTLLHALAKTPEQRPPTALALVNALSQTMPAFTSPIQTPTHTTAYLPSNTQFVHTPSAPVSIGTLPPAPPSSETVTRRNVLIASAAGVLVVAGAGIIYAISQNTTSHGPHAPTGPTPVANLDTPVLQIQSTFTQSVTQLTWSPSTNTLAATDAAHGGVDGGHVLLWNVHSGTMSNPQPDAQLNFPFASSIGIGSIGIAWSGDGSMLAMGPDNNYQTQVYKKDLSGLASGFASNTIASHNRSTVEGLACSPGNYIFVTENMSSDASHVLLRTFNAKQPQQKLPDTQLPIPVSFTYAFSQRTPVAPAPDGSHFAYGTTGGVTVGTLTINNTQIKWQQQTQLPTSDEVYAVAWSSDSHYIAALTSSDSSLAQCTVTVWDVQQHKALALNFSKVRGQPTALAWSPSSARPFFAIGGSNGNVLIWNVSTNTNPVHVLSANTNRVTALAWSYDGQWLAASYDDAAASILIWRVADIHG